MDLLKITAWCLLIVYVLSVAMSGVTFYHALKHNKIWLHSIGRVGWHHAWRETTRSEILVMGIWILICVFGPLVNTSAAFAGIVCYWPTTNPRCMTWWNVRPFKKE
jgi:hypothetical protein